MAKFNLEIVTPQRIALNEEVEIVTAPGADGEFGVLRDHTLVISVLKPGVVTCETSSGTLTLAVGSGYAEVYPEKTMLLVDSAELSTEIDSEEAASTLREAEEKLSGVSDDAHDYKKLLISKEHAEARVEAAGN
ncbi:MAG: ATP synthase F1 subunit epsilon [Deltaproteobacteria bacterium]|nr:ATP synthase F1 subunit epsilon [Deltaproteobacteria bacterium]